MKIQEYKTIVLGDDAELTIVYTLHEASFKGDHLQPPDPDEYEIEQVLVSVYGKTLDITPFTDQLSHELDWERMHESIRNHEP